MPVAGVPWGQERGALATTVAQGEAPPPTHVGGGRAATTSRNYCGHPPDAARPLAAAWAASPAALGRHHHLPSSAAAVPGTATTTGAGRPGRARPLQEDLRCSDAEVRGGSSPQSRLLNLHPHHRRRKTGRPPCGPSPRRCPGTGRACTASPSTGRGGEGGRRLGVEFWCAVCFFTLPAGLSGW